MDKKSASIVAGDMKRSPSELALEELFKHPIVTDVAGDSDENVFNQDEKCFADMCSADICFPLRNRPELADGFSSCGLTKMPLWSKDHTPKLPSIPATTDSPSSICVDSPNSATNRKGRDNQAMGATSGSSREQSEDDDLETEVGPCEHSTEAIDMRRIKRMVSNRESARRSRRRKQAHLADLEQQVEQLRGENASLFGQFTNATQQFKDATTNNRVLKSDVEALRAKVKLAEDVVARGCLTPSLSHLLQNHLNTPQSFGTPNMCRVGNVSPTIDVRRDDALYPGISVSGQNPALGLETSDTFSDLSDFWPLESHVPTMSK